MRLFGDWDIAEAPHAAGRRLLVASIAQSASEGNRQPGSLRLPRLDAHLPGGLHFSLKRVFQPGSVTSRNKQKVSQGLSPPNLGAAGAQLQHAAAAASGMLLAAISQAAQHFAQARPGHASQTLPFHQSFKLPWNSGTRTGSRRATRESAALAKALSVRGHDYERSLDVRAAVQCFEEACKLVPGSAAYLSMAAKCWSDLTFYYDVKSDRERQLVNLKAIEFAQKCIEEHPSVAYGHVAMCISKGRLALFTDNKTKVRLAREAQQCAQTALSLDPSSDVAHHLMGRWHYEMAQINMMLRTMIKVMYGTELASGTRQDALASFKRAAELAPNRLIHRVEAGRVHLDLGQVQEAVQELEAALACEVEDINSWHTRMDAEKLLAQVRRQPWKQPSLVPPHAQQQEQAAASGAAPAASISTAALLSGCRQPEIINEAVQLAELPPTQPSSAMAA